MSKKSKQRHFQKGVFEGAPSHFGIARRGEKAFKQADYRQAIQEWSHLLNDSSVKPSLRKSVETGLAEAYFRYGQHILFIDAHQSCILIENAAKTLPDDPLYAYHAGLALHRHHQLDEAITWYREALRRDPSFKRACYPLALALVEGGQDVIRDPVWNELDEAHRAHLKCLPDDEHVSQGLLYASQDNWVKAEEAFTLAIQKPAPPLVKGLAHHYLGMIAMRQENEQAAMEHWQQAQDCGLNTPTSIHNLISMCLKNIEQAFVAGQADRVLQLITLCREAAPGTLPEDVEYAAQSMIGYDNAVQGKWQEALKCWEPLKEIPGAQGRSASANVALAYEKLSHWAKAAESWREFARRRSRKENSADWLSPDQVARLWSRIAILYKQADMPDEAAKTLQNALKYQPDDPTLLLALAHCHMDQERYDAAENRVDEVLKDSPQNGEALMLKATLAEIKPYWLAFFNKSTPGLEEWERVEQLNDETYAPIARERLDEIYEEDFDQKYAHRMYKEAAQTARKWIERDPRDQQRRARLAHVLILAKAKKAEIEKEIGQIDLTDEEALHQIIDAWHKIEKHKEARTLLKQVEEQKPLTPDFYIGVADCAFNRKQPDIGEAYINEALQRASDPIKLSRTKTRIGYLYMENQQTERAKALWESVLEADRHFGPALHAMALVALHDMDFKQARRYLTLAQRWATANNDTELLASIETSRRIVSRSQSFFWDY